jgi:hypothetical protein
MNRSVFREPCSQTELKLRVIGFQIWKELDKVFIQTIWEGLVVGSKSPGENQDENYNHCSKVRGQQPAKPFGGWVLFSHENVEGADIGDGGGSLRMWGNLVTVSPPAKGRLAASVDAIYHKVGDLFFSYCDPRTQSPTFSSPPTVCHQTTCQIFAPEPWGTIGGSGGRGTAGSGKKQPLIAFTWFPSLALEQLLTELDDFLRILDQENLSSTAMVKKSGLAELLRLYTKSSSKCGPGASDMSHGNGKMAALVHLGFHNKVPQTKWL